MEITGHVFKVLPIKEGVSKATNNPWKMQPFLLRIDRQYNDTIYFEIFGRYVDEIQLREGEDVTVSFDIDSREYNGSWFTSVRAWRVQPVTKNSSEARSFSSSSNGGNAEANRGSDTPSLEKYVPGEDESSDLPF